MTTPGGLGAFVGEPASAFTDRVVPLGAALGVDEPSLVHDVVTAVAAPADGLVAAPVDGRWVRPLAEALERAMDPGRAVAAREVAGIARLAENDRSVRRLADLCAAAGLGERTLQRLFLRFAGVSPTWVLRRYRPLDAAEAVRDGTPVVWADVAAELDYSDQAHLVRDFRAATGRTPAAYAHSRRRSRS